jgi:hypothetical protein
MKTFAIALGAVTLAVVLVAVGFLVATAWSQGRWGYGMMGPGMMGGSWYWPDMHRGQGYTVRGDRDLSSLEDVEAVVDEYVHQLGSSDLTVTEVMEFERNYYAIVAESDTGIGAMELLVDKASGAVGPEPGPNIMWNAKYGMMGGTSTGEMTLSPAEAQDVAQRWLDSNLPGRTAGEADEFYGYYTLHFLRNGEIDGMLSVDGSSGDVWYHSWHGGFIAMTEGHS